MNRITRSIIIFVMIHYTSLASADYKDDIAYNRLALELGANMPDGSNIIATHVEAGAGTVDHDNNPLTAELPVYLPDGNDNALAGRSIIDMTGKASGSYSSHATGVARLFYGDNALAQNINTVHAYEANDWIGSNFLNASGGKPQSSSSRIANHSWVGNTSDLNVTSNILRHLDWLIATDEYLQIVGVLNQAVTNYTLSSAAYNVLAVGKTDGQHSTGSSFVDATYPAGRTRTEIVAPLTTPSSATPVVSATAALLVDLGHSNPVLSTDSLETSTSNRKGDQIFNAERSEVIKAALLAGADRLTQNISSSDNISDYRVDLGNQTNNGMDARFGAGQLNVYNAYHIVAAGEQNSGEDGGAGSSSIGVYGFDYDPAFGGANSSNNVASYYFSTGSVAEVLSTSLVWHISIDGGNGPNFSGAATFYDLDINLYDVTGTQTLVLGSNSVIDNSENIWTALSANRDYVLKITPKSGQSSFSWDYALAWQRAPDHDADGIADSVDADDDNDGLSDATEQSLGTNPLLSDTDDDGYSDADEVNAGSDPLDKNSIPASGADGDLNKDGLINIMDILIGQQILAGIIPLTADHLIHGDVAPLNNGAPSPDAVFDLGDVVVIQQKILGIISF